jgi:excisionase family DNA binding protein
MGSAADALSQVIEQAVAVGIRKALGSIDNTSRRLFSIDQAGTYLCLSERELYNMLANKELVAVKHGRRTMLDVRDLDRWIESNKR